MKQKLIKQFENGTDFSVCVIAMENGTYVVTEYDFVNKKHELKGKYKDKNQALMAAKEINKSFMQPSKQTIELSESQEANNSSKLTMSKLSKMIAESIQTHLVGVLGKYTAGKASSEQANKAIMDLANSSNTNLNESFKSRIIKNFADKYGIGYADPALSEITDDMIFNSDIVTEYPGWAVKDPKNYLVYKGKNDVWLILGVNQNFKDNFDYDYFDWGSRKPYPKDKSDELKRRRTKWDGQQGVKRDDGKYNYVYHSKMNNNHFLKNYTNKDFSNDMYWKKELG